jgi:DNA-binding GntR family transcriptional regulator
VDRLRPVERKRLFDLAYTAIRESIISGEFAMGERLVETELANELQMSRAPVREAIRHLAKEGLIEEHPHRGAFVATITAADVGDIYNVRLGLEITGLRLFMKSGASTKPLWQAIKQMEKAAERGQIAEVVRAEFEFHRYIAQSAGNALLATIFNDLEGRFMMAIALDDQSFDQLNEIAAEHVPVVEAIDAGDERKAVLTFEEHLLSTVGELLKRLGRDRSLLLEPFDA